MSEQSAASRTSVAWGWRPKLGLLFLILAVVSPLLEPLVLTSDLPREVKGALAGLLLFGVPMALMLAVVALVGQPAFRFIKSLFAGKNASPTMVSLTRYRIGLVLLILGVLVSWIEPLVSPHFPEIAARRVLIGALADGAVLVSLFVLGGEFWDKVHALFVHNARVVPEDSGKAAAAPAAVEVGWRFYLGVVVVVLSVSSWLLVPLASAAGWSTSKIASLTGAIFIGVKVGVIAAAAIMGKDGFNYLKRLLFGFFRKFAPAQQVSRTRYCLGLILFLVPIFMTWVAPYVTGILRPEGVFASLQDRSLEVLLLIGLFMLGGDFWDKLAALFKYRAKVEFGARTPMV